MSQKPTKFYQLSREERLEQLKDNLTTESYQQYLTQSLLDDAVANSLIENQVSQFPLPLGVARNFIVNQQAYTIPMVVEEPSVIAACSNAAKIFQPDGFTTSCEESLMTGQIILTDVSHLEDAKAHLLKHFSEIQQLAQDCHPSIVKRGGGLKTLDVRFFSDHVTATDYLTVYLTVDTKDAMGANIVNTILEGVTPLVADLISGTVLMSILSNYTTQSLVTANCAIDIDLIPNKSAVDQKDLAQKIVAASRYAKLDPYRAATHNKGIMNGVDSVIIATGNDPRAVEAGIHAYAARNGRYEGLSDWKIQDNQLIGTLTLPLSIGTVGGAISVLPLAKANLDLLGNPTALELAQIVVAVGLAQNFAALKALVSEGIQKGHMALHASSLAIQVGATGPEIEQVATALRQESQMSTMIATKILAELRR